MAVELITSTGKLGADFDRSDGRAYLNVSDRVNHVRGFLDVKKDFDMQALEQGRRRSVIRAIVKSDTADKIKGQVVPEANIPLDIIGQPENTLLVFGNNVHRSETPEWLEVHDYWRKPMRKFTPPAQRMTDLAEEGYQFISAPRVCDREDLYQIWKPFGWTRQGVAVKITEFEVGGGGWFSGIVNRNDRLVSACMGEKLEMPRVALLEGTEYGTAENARGKGLCSAVVAGLHAQMLRDTLYSGENMPLIFSEFNMSVRSDVVGRHTGMVIPLVREGEMCAFPVQLLRRNVSVLDGQPVNDLSPDELGIMADFFRKSYGKTYPYWRNFVVGVLPKTAIDTHYSEQTVKEMADMYVNPR